MKTNAEYLKNSSVCPRCGSSDLEGGSFDVDAGTAGQELNCAGCGLSYWDEYHLVGYTVFEEPEPGPDPEETERRALSDAGGKAYP